MEKENKTIIISKEVYYKKAVEKYDYCYDYKNNNKSLEKNIKQADKIVIYDITQNSQHGSGEKLYVKDHINQTGQNPLLSTKPIKFVDLTELYTIKKGAVITTCIGKKYSADKNNFLYPSTEIALISILCKKINPEVNILGILINCL